MYGEIPMSMRASRNQSASYSRSLGRAAARGIEDNRARAPI
jgi:hypothetical protein